MRVVSLLAVVKQASIDVDACVVVSSVASLADEIWG